MDNRAIVDHYRVKRPMILCPVCGEESNNDASVAGILYTKLTGRLVEPQKMREGDATICIACASILAFYNDPTDPTGGRIFTRVPTSLDVARWRKDKQLWALLRKAQETTRQVLKEHGLPLARPSKVQ